MSILKIFIPMMSPQLSYSYILLILLLLLRYYTILPNNNVLLDCDEVYNYWEPLLYTVKDTDTDTDTVKTLNNIMSFQVR